MKARLASFGEIDIAGERYSHDVVIDNGQVSKRKASASKPYRDPYGQTRPSAQETIPSHRRKLSIGTEAYGKLLVMPEVYKEAEKKGVKVIAKPSVAMCSPLKKLGPKDVNAVGQVTC